MSKCSQINKIICFQREHLHDVPDFDPLPLDVARHSPQRDIPHPRPYLHLLRHCGQLYARCVVGDWWLAGVVDIYLAVGDGDFRNLL